MCCKEDREFPAVIGPSYLTTSRAKCYDAVKRRWIGQAIDADVCKLFFIPLSRFKICFIFQK